MMIYYHRTDALHSIIVDGFRDGPGRGYGMPEILLIGVWISDRPLDSNEGANGQHCLEIQAADNLDLSEYEVVTEGFSGYREWCVPAEVLNEHAGVRRMSESELGDLVDDRWPRIGASNEPGAHRWAGDT